MIDIVCVIFLNISILSLLTTIVILSRRITKIEYKMLDLEVFVNNHWNRIMNDKIKELVDFLNIEIITREGINNHKPISNQEIEFIKHSKNELRIYEYVLYKVKKIFKITDCDHEFFNNFTCSSSGCNQYEVCIKCGFIKR